MNFILTSLTILTLSICGPGKNTIEEKREFTKPPVQENGQVIKFKKVPTKWVKITKKSN